VADDAGSGAHALEEPADERCARVFARLAIERSSDTMSTWF
jgi:hypothetical protein